MAELSGDLNRLYGAFLALGNADEAARLLEDLCTRQELEEMARRLLVAGLLRRGVNYQEIARQSGVSTATISRVNRALRYGAGGYTLVLDRLDGKEAAP